MIPTATVPTRLAKALAAVDAVTPSELRVLELASHGLRNKQIAVELGRSEETVKAQLKTAFIKLDARSRAHACAIALRRGIIV